MGNTQAHVIVSPGPKNMTREDWNNMVARCRAMGVDQKREDSVEPGSEQDISRWFLDSLGFVTMGNFAHLYEYTARYEPGKETVGEESHDSEDEDHPSRKRKRT